MYHLASLLQHFLSSFNFQNTVSNSARMHHLASLISNCSKQFQRTNHRSNSARMNHLASLLLNFSQQFHLSKQHFEKRQNASFSFDAFPIFSAIFFIKIVLNSARIHHFASLLLNFFSAVPTSRTSFEIASECTI